jgi:hypothetical protein
MNMIVINLYPDDFNIVRHTNLTGLFQNAMGNVSFPNRLAMFRDHNTLISYAVNGMTRLPAVLHAASILKSSPEGEGFSPNPRRGQ